MLCHFSPTYKTIKSPQILNNMGMSFMLSIKLPQTLQFVDISTLKFLHGCIIEDDHFALVSNFSRCMNFFYHIDSASLLTTCSPNLIC